MQLLDSTVSNSQVKENCWLAWVLNNQAMIKCESDIGIFLITVHM